MAILTERGLAKLDILRDYWPPQHDPPKRRISSVKMRQKYLLLEVEKSPTFHIDQHSILRPDWNRLRDRGLIDTNPETPIVIESTDRSLY